MKIRLEHGRDEAAISAITAAAFAGMSFSRQTEHFIIDALRRQNGLTISLVAEDAGEIVGHVAFSPIAIDGQPRNWHALGPVAVVPERQRQGIGTSMILEGLDRLRALKSGGCVVLGNPAYYQRFGFRHDARLFYKSAPAPHFMIQPFGASTPEGEVAFHPAFDATA